MSRFERLMIDSLLDDGRLEVNGVLKLDGEVLVNNNPMPEANPEEVNEYGFFGEPTEYFGRRNKITEAIIDEWANSEDPFDKKAAADAPRLLVFFDDIEQLENRELKKLLFKNHNYWWLVATKNNRIVPLVDENNADIENHYFVALGNYNDPRKEGRDKYINRIGDYMTHWLNSRKEFLQFGHVFRER
ncbi:MAG: hypothetical protein OQK29_06645 [Ignavibacteriaceae bacterium]|nr:hypothetical protein [Ignavibacteriaceae bacterium]